MLIDVVFDFDQILSRHLDPGPPSGKPKGTRVGSGALSGADKGGFDKIRLKIVKEIILVVF